MISAATIYARLARHFVARLAHDRALVAVERAIGLGVLERANQPNGASLFRLGSRIAGWTLARVKLLLRQAFGPLSLAEEQGNAQPDTGQTSLLGDVVPETPLEGIAQGWSEGDEFPEARRRRARRSAAAAAGSAGVEVSALGATEEETALPAKSKRGSPNESPRRRRRQPTIDRMAVLRLVRGKAMPPSAAEVATLLLLADAVARSGHDIADLLAILRRPKPIVAITGTVPGFEAAFLELLRCGFVLPGSSSFISAYDLNAINEHRRSVIAARTVILFQGKESSSDAELVARKVSLAVQNALPILAVADDAGRLPQSLVDTADINLVCSPITPELIRQLMQVMLGDRPARASGPTGERTSPASADEAVFPAGYEASAHLDGCELLTITDLGLAIRPGMSPGRSLVLLRSLIDRARKDHDEQAATSAEDDDGDTWSGRRGRSGLGSSGSVLIEPELVDGRNDGNGSSSLTSGKPALLVEKLAGYGAARDWALALKADLQLWREGRLDWSEMSTRLLLAGPPGTGKTTFARALANSLQLRLFATSVGTWLEPGYLGEVLRRMSAAFAEAEANAPCILFIDEIDGIGRRAHGGAGIGRRHYDDYWVSLVNRALELLDGVTRSQGVIVIGATNNPDAIDPALLRSGRLETRIDIPLPDVDALVGILRHHLAGDLDAVVASAVTPAERATFHPPYPNDVTTTPDDAGRGSGPPSGPPSGTGNEVARPENVRPGRQRGWPGIGTLMRKLTLRGGTNAW